MERKSVKSSQIASVGYDRARRVLEIQFVSRAPGGGSVYQYDDVPENVALELIHADSVGTYFGAHVKTQFVTWKIGPNGERSPISTVKATVAQRDYLRNLARRVGLVADGSSDERMGPLWRPVVVAAGQPETAYTTTWPTVDAWMAELSQAQASAVIDYLKARV